MNVICQKIINSERLIQWLDGKLDGVPIPSNLRCRLAGGSLDTALEHHKAIVMLVAHQLYGSAFALVRLVFEAYVRGVWLHQCASQTEIEQFEKKKFEKKFFELLVDIEKLDAFKSGILSAAKKKSWDVMNGFTHTGFNQIIRRNTADSIAPNYDDFEILEALNFANAIGLMSAVEIAHIGSNDPLANEVLEKVKNEFQSAF